MVESKDNRFSAIVVKLIAGLPPESSAAIKYIVGLATSLGKPALATHSHVAPEPYCHDSRFRTDPKLHTD
jgi:hypothetical protein